MVRFLPPKRNESHLFHYLVETLLENHNTKNCMRVIWDVEGSIFDIGYPNPLYVHNSLHKHTCALGWGDIIPIKDESHPP